MKFLLIILGLSSLVLPTAAVPAIWCVSETYFPEVCNGYEETIQGDLATKLNNEIEGDNEIEVGYSLNRNLHVGVDERELINCSYSTEYPESWCFLILCPGYPSPQESSTSEVTCADLVNAAENELNRVSETLDNEECREALKAVTCGCEEEDSV
jgi:hypothetical protein